MMSPAIPATIDSAVARMAEGIADDTANSNDVQPRPHAALMIGSHK